MRLYVETKNAQNVFVTFMEEGKKKEQLLPSFRW